MSYSIEEKECHINYDCYENKTIVWTNDRKSMTKFLKANWNVKSKEMEGDTVIAMKFESDGFPITARDITKPKRKGNCLFNVKREITSKTAE